MLQIITYILNVSFKSNQPLNHSNKYNSPNYNILIVAGGVGSDKMSQGGFENSFSMSSALEREEFNDRARKDVLDRKINPGMYTLAPLQNQLTNLNTHTFLDQSVLSLFEIGTGDYIGEVHKVRTITSIAFSFDGSHLAIGSHKGIMTVLTIEDSIRDNIYEVLDGMMKNPYFWSDFQLEIGERNL